jgi:HAD superfamily hydrolase (TIGR01549 family)
MKNQKIIGFDFDGVIVNSLPAMEKSWTNLKLELNIKVDFEAYKRHIGLKFFDILDKIGIDKSLYDEVYKLYFEGTKKFQDYVTLYPGVKNTLEQLKNLETQTFIITSKPRENTLLLLEKFNIQTDLLVCADDVIFGKPHIEAGQLAIKKFLSSNIVYVGDMESDMQFADNCNFEFIHANYGYGEIHSTNNLIEIESFEKVLNFI